MPSEWEQLQRKRLLPKLYSSQAAPFHRLNISQRQHLYEAYGWALYFLQSLLIIYKILSNMYVFKILACLRSSDQQTWKETRKKKKHTHKKKNNQKAHNLTLQEQQSTHLNSYSVILLKPAVHLQTKSLPR